MMSTGISARVENDGSKGEVVKEIDLIELDVDFIELLLKHHERSIEFVWRERFHRQQYYCRIDEIMMMRDLRILLHDEERGF